ncbi:hypothetical protein [Paenibacillus kribbensis]|uniref:hypothetical protein n=1 Tax=Paenibacillus kribbensis TaxID=172713 RepID=UPI0021174E11|nr:hypothetical protein [Paenibacillus kribbensis]
MRNREVPHRRSKDIFIRCNELITEFIYLDKLYSLGIRQQLIERSVGVSFSPLK